MRTQVQRLEQISVHLLGQGMQKIDVYREFDIFQLILKFLDL